MCIPYIKYCTLNFKTGKTVRGAVPRRHRLVSGCKSNIGGKTLRDRYGQNATGPVRAKRYGAHTGYGLGAVRDTVWARYVARTFPRVKPVRATYRAPLGARTTYCWDCPYHARTGMFTGTLLINCFFRCSVHHMNGQPDN